MADNTDELQDVLTDATRTQFAALSAAVSFWSAWAESSAGYARGMTDELTRLSVEDVASDEALGRMVDLNRKYLEELTELPTAAANRFSEEVEKIEKRRSRSTGARKPQRRAKAKP